MKTFTNAAGRTSTIALDLSTASKQKKVLAVGFIK